MKRLIVTADDVGLDRGMTAGAIEAHRNGIVTACSVVANGAAFEDAVARLRDVPTLELGAHLALVEERAISTGRPMPAGYASFVARYVSGRVRREWIERELRLQIERLLAYGLELRFLNGHQHLHALPGVFEVVVRLAEEYRIGYVRVPAERRVRGVSLRAGSVRLLRTVARHAARAAAGRVATNGATIGILGAGHLRAPDLVTLLDDVEGLTELVTHPGLEVEGYAHWNYDWTRETGALCDPVVRRAIDARGITLVRPSEALV